ncbi:serine/threonine-protein kinase [Actinoplanes campanulatus]|uniref:non-specific serine/threonine protein kinase n=1 Tax=Actinoplanes campanulatus TaxID=113559 RepID=A0A7W5APK1_9ACTN|nr:serine/threonine-protein kinase [Actinoplanes campanulatus]MBB3100082.1 serine/threonine-protein kinase [Actinoplanes campanulatus]GGN29037.1 putative serine/threonine-protein kinase PknA [Actinoplanes campanulatus]
MLNAGNLLDNRYRLDERVATGGMGDVWRGTDVVLGRTVAVKVLRTAMLEDPEFAARFYGEARMMAAFRHPGVVEVYDYASDGDYEGPEKVAYLVMAFVEGEPLSARVKEGQLGVAETMSIVAQAADALHAAHENGIVHRDVKPGNLIVKPTGAVILVDFGVARSNAMTSVTGVNAIVGTALYMAPEQVAKGNLTPATDIYALGAVAYHCIAGVPPFDGDNALQVALRHLEDDPDPLPDHVPYEVRDLIARAMAKQPADRFQSAAEFAEAAFAVAGPMDWKRLTGTTLAAPISPAARMGSGQFPVTRMGTGQFPTMPISPAAPRPAPMQRAVPAPVPFTRPGSKAAQPPAQRLLMFAILALFLVAGGIGVAFAFKGDTPAPGSTGKQNQGNQADPIGPPPPSAEDSPSAVETSETNTRPTRTKKTPASRSASPSSASPSVSSSAPDPTDPTTTPTTEPTTDPTTTAPTTPTTDPVTDPPVNPGG